MSNRRLDAIYFGLILVVSLVGYFAANLESDLNGESVALKMPNFSPLQLDFEVPFDFPYAIVKFKNIAPPRLKLSNDMESALSEVRSALLASSALVEVRPSESLVAAIE